MDGFTYLSTAQLVANASQPVFFTCMLRYFPATDEFPFVTTSQQWQRTSGYDSDDDNGSNSNATMQRRMNATDNERTNNGQRTNERTTTQHKNSIVSRYDVNALLSKPFKSEISALRDPLVEG